MRFNNLKEETRDIIKAFTISGILIILFYELLQHIPTFFQFLSEFFSALAPFIFGFCFAFLLAPLRKIVEYKWFKNVKWSQKTKRKWATAISMIFMIAVLVGFCIILVPQLFDSIRTLASSMGTYARSIQDLIDNFTGSDSQYGEIIYDMFNDVGTRIAEWLTGAEGGVAKIMSYSVSFVKGVFNFFIGLIVAIYLLNDEERFKIQWNKILYALLPNKVADRINEVVGLTGESFNKFIFGKAIDSLIIGIACYICCSLMQLPYSPLIGFVVGITNMIPVFGPFIGAIPCILILLMINIWQAAEFAIFILILQQIDGNILGPYILGDSMGLPTLWVMFAIIIGGALFGVPGMFIGVPIFSVIYTLVRKWTEKRIEKKQIVISEDGNGRIKPDESKGS